MDKNDEFEGNVDEQGDGFGLPDVDYKPLDGSNVHESQNQGYSFPEDDEPESKAPLIIGIVIGAIILLGGGGALVYNYVIEPKMEKERQEELAREKRDNQIKERERLAKIEREKDGMRRKAVADSIAKVEADIKSGLVSVSGEAGNIETLSEPVGLYHIIVSSGLDDDLLMDYAKSLKKKGVSTKIISPYGNVKLHRLAVGETFNTYAKAQEKASTIGEVYKGGTWVLKY